MRMAVIGGDTRSMLLADMFETDGFSVRRYALPSGNSSAIEETLSDVELLVGPTPLMRGGALNAPFFDKPIPINSLLMNVQPTARFFAGVIPKDIRRQMDENGILWRDFTDDEQLTIDNAIPSAEGAIQLAMLRMDITLHGSNALVLGYGRIGKALTRMLIGIGASVSVYARREESLAQAEAAGALPVPQSAMLEALGRMDAIFNTIPAMVLGQARLARTLPSVEIVDLASAPGGVDFHAAKVLHRSANLDLGLPGKVAPRSAAKYMKSSIDRFLYREK